jgi:HK97 family phage major capsid protein
MSAAICGETSEPGCRRAHPGYAWLLIAIGDFRRGYLIVDRAGVRVLRDPFTAKPYILFYTTKRVGGGVQDFDAIKLLKFAVS